ncbi:MAG: hypothetical protein ACYS9X_32130, partial [Planctomycetota bacterium]
MGEEATNPDATETAPRGVPAAPGPRETEGLPDLVRFPLVLGIVCVVSAASLAGIYGLTREEIERSKTRKVENAFETVLGERYDSAAEITGKADEAGGRGKKEDMDEKLFVLRNSAGAIAGYAAQVKCPGSYAASDPVQIVVVADPAIERLLGLRVVKSAETPGLGERIKESPSARSLVGAMTGADEKRRLVLKGGGAVVGLERSDGSYDCRTFKGEARDVKPGDVLKTSEPPFPPAFLDQFTRLPAREAKLRAQGGRIDG